MSEQTTRREVLRGGLAAAGLGVLGVPEWVLPALAQGATVVPFIGDFPDNFNPNYLMRSMHQMPKSGDKPEWKHDQDYWSEKDIIPTANLEDGCLVFE